MPFFFSGLFHQFSSTVVSRWASLPFVAEPAPPRSLYAVNATHSSVTLLWAEEGVVDYYQVLCKASGGKKELKVTTIAGRSGRPGTAQLAVSFCVSLSFRNEFSFIFCQAREPQLVSSQLVMVSGLTPASTYNCSVTSFSYSTPSKPVHISITTTGRQH